MSKKVTLSGLVLCLVLFGLIMVCFADVSAQFEQAEAYKNSGKILQAEEIYKTIIADYPGTNDALKAHKELVILYILAKRDGDAGTALDKLTADFSEHEDLPAALFEIARQYEWSVKYPEAKNLFQKILDDHSESWFVNRADIAVVRTNIMGLITSGKDDEAAAAINELFNNEDLAGHADLSGALYSFAKSYEWSGKYEDANSIYEQLIQQYPDSLSGDMAKFDIPRMNVLSLFASSDTTAAYEALNNLIANFNDNPDLQLALYGIAETCRAFKKYEDANSIYEQLVERYPESSYAGKAQLEISEMAALSLIETEDEAAAGSAVNEIAKDFSNHSDLPASLYNIAKKYDLSRKFEDANNVYRQIVQEYPNSLQAAKARLHLAKISIIFLINSGEDDAVGTALDNLIAGFNDYPELPTEVFMVGDQYYRKALENENQGHYQQSKDCFRKARNVWKRIITELPPSFPDTPHAYYYSAICYRKLDEYEKAIEYYQKVVSDWPDYDHAGKAQFLIGNYYERLVHSGAIPESQANSKIEQAYEEVVEKYPNNESAKYVCLRLGQLNFKKGLWAKAARYFELLLNKNSGNKRPCQVLYALGRTYDKMSESDKAIQVYDEFIKVAQQSDPCVERVKARLEELRATNE